MSSILDVSMLEGSQNFTLDHLSQIKIASMEKLSNGHALESSPEQLPEGLLLRKSPCV